jgi:hypothetical protein
VTFEIVLTRENSSWPSCRSSGGWSRIAVAELGCPPKLVSNRNNRNWNRNWFRHYPKQEVCFGCFALISKQGVSVFRNNRNKQKTNRNSSKFGKKNNLFIPYYKFCLFRLFRYRSETSKQTEKNFFAFAKKQTETPPKQIEFLFVSVRTEKKKRFQEPPNRECFLEIFSVCFEKILFVSVVSIPIRNTETNQNKPKIMFFCFAKQTEKQPKQIKFRFVSVRTEKKI